MKYFYFLLLSVVAGTFNLSAQSYDHFIFNYYNILFANQTEKPDSIVYYNVDDGTNESKTTFEFNEKGKLTSYTVYFWNEDKWEPDFKEKAMYDPDGDPQSVAYLTFSTNEEWEPEYEATIYKQAYENGKVYALQFFISGSDVKFQEKYDYDNKGQVSSIWLQNFVESDWENDRLIILERNDNNHITESKDYFFYNGTTAGQKNTFNPDENGKVTSVDIYYLLDSKTDKWESKHNEYGKYFYSAPSGIRNIPQLLEAKAWMNGQTLQVESETGIVSVAIYNTAGMMMYINEGRNTNSYALSGRVGRGMYVVRLKGDDGSSTTVKLLIR